MTDQGALLSAASLLLAVLGMLYSLWHSSIQRALDFTPDNACPDQDREHYFEAGSTLVVKAVPLAVVSAALSALFYVPTCWPIVRTSLSSIDGNYQPVWAAHLAVSGVFLALTVQAVVRVMALVRQRTALNPERTSVLAESNGDDE